MCERNDTPAGETGENLVYHRFKKKLAESYVCFSLWFCSIFCFVLLFIKRNYQITCRKCNTNPGYILLQKKDVFCGDCLSQYCRQKFRATLGKSKLFSSTTNMNTCDRVLVAFSGGIASVALVDLIKLGLGEDFHRKLRFVPSLIHIDGIVFNTNLIFFNFHF